LIVRSVSVVRIKILQTEDIDVEVIRGRAFAMKP